MIRPRTASCLETFKMDNMFHNRTAAEIAEMAFDAQRRMEAAKEELDACKAKLVEIAGGGKFAMSVPGVCRVIIGEPQVNVYKVAYNVSMEAFEKLDDELKLFLLEREVLKEKKRPDRNRLPPVKITPI